MSEITEQEAREALRVYNEVSTPTVRGFASLVAIDWARQELARREAERDEREKPITAEWCLANGAEGYEAGFEMVYGWDLGWCEFNWREERGVGFISATSIFTST